MDETFVQYRIAELRVKKGVSAREMSMAIAQSPNYINHIENGQSLPSLTALVYICDYLGITLKQFFNDGKETPYELQVLLNKLEKLDEESLAHVSAVIDAFLPKE